MSTSTPSQGSLDRIETTPKSGNERFRDGSVDLGFDLRSFWSWCVSDLVSNATRGILAEYLVARALDAEPKLVRDEWAAYDLLTPEGIKVEVKSSGYLQTWKQAELTEIKFGIPMTKGWDAHTGGAATESRRQADVYVFALFEHTDKVTVEPMDLAQWRFFVIKTLALNRLRSAKKDINLSQLQSAAGPGVKYAHLRQTVLAEWQRPV